MEAANYGILSLIPLALTLLLAFWKKDAVFALFMGCLSGVLLLGHDPAFGFSALAEEALGNEDFIWILLIQVFIGIMIAFFMKAGVVKAFAEMIAGKVKSPRSVKLATWFIGLFTIDDYMSPLLRGVVMRPLTDEMRVPREKLAFILDSTCASVCTLMPFMAWGAYVAGLVADSLEGMAALAGDAKAMKTALAETADAVGDTMALLRPATEKLLTSLESTIDDLEGLTTDEYMDTLVNILGGDPAVYGQYFPEMVQTSVNAVYPIANYGSAMTPFYTVLAIWVGGVILSSLIKIHARTEGLIDPKPAELYFGRYLFFFVLSQIQAAVIVTGDLYILKVQCLHPGMLYLTGALTAFTFSLLIYSLAISFGDVGKAIVVVIMVMQIAGSSGTFPIELLPAIYQKIYRFFPFPYAIDAMRECICGMYGNYYWQQIGFLLLFAAAALLIGLLVRRPFMGLNHFMEEKLEETELL